MRILSSALGPVVVVLVFSGCRRDMPKDPEIVILDGKPISTMLETAPEPEKDRAERISELKGHHVEDIRIRSLGNPIGRSDLKKLSGFRYVYSEYKSGAVSSLGEISQILDGLKAGLAKAGVRHGLPFLLIFESASGWLFRETVRVCIPVLDEAELPADMTSARHEGAMVLVSSLKTIPSNGSLDEMERWAEQALKAAAGKEVDFSGPFMMRVARDDLSFEGAESVDWIVPAGPLPVKARSVGAPEPASAGAEVE